MLGSIPSNQTIFITTSSQCFAATKMLDTNWVICVTLFILRNVLKSIIHFIYSSRRTWSTNGVILLSSIIRNLERLHSHISASCIIIEINITYNNRSNMVFDYLVCNRITSLNMLFYQSINTSQIKELRLVIVYNIE